MILIADSGSTKTDWIFCNASQGINAKNETVGFNPIVQNREFIREKILQSFSGHPLRDKVRKLYFFGAGCSSLDRQNIIKDILSPIFTNAEIQVDHDMKAAVIATCGDDAGFACILGTGSNAVFYDGEKIVEPKGILGIGYILGDEGSGAYVGKMILRDFLYKKLPSEIHQHFTDNLQLSKDIIFQNVYQKPNANTYLTTFAKELFPFKKSEYVKDIFTRSFSDFFEYNIRIYEHYELFPVHFIGSIATHYNEELAIAAKNSGVQLGKIIQKPIDHIVDYYIQS